MKKFHADAPAARKRLLPSPSLQPGSAPGSLAPVTDSQGARISLLRVGNEQVTISQLPPGAEHLPGAAPEPACCAWLRVCGLGELAPLRMLSEKYKLPHLALEDVLSTGWRTKFEESGDYLFFQLQCPGASVSGQKGGHISLFCRPGLVISFESSPTEIIDALWARLSAPGLRKNPRNMSAYLSYALIDYIVDRFFPLLEKKDEELAALEEKLDSHSVPERSELDALHRIRRNILALRRLHSPYKELANWLKCRRTDTEWEELRPYLNDLSDHVIQAGELIDAYHDMGNALHDIYQSSMGNRMNDVMRTLTIISTVFMPLSFLAGVYGMNFNVEASPWNMPELANPYGYPVVLAVMAGIFIAMMLFFKRKKWF